MPWDYSFCANLTTTCLGMSQTCPYVQLLPISNIKKKTAQNDRFVDWISSMGVYFVLFLLVLQEAMIFTNHFLWTFSLHLDNSHRKRVFSATLFMYWKSAKTGRKLYIQVTKEHLLNTFLNDWPAAHSQYIFVRAKFAKFRCW